ncbi:MAG: aspartate aminotransferase family protein [Thermoplasmata archaeon]|nr:aspartate aminotransferase family protein [Thermoplasmata archaeon]
MDAETFRRFGHEVVDWVANYLQEVEHYPVLSPVSPGEVREQIPSSPPPVGETMEAVLGDFQDIILPGITHWNHPRFFAYFPANNSGPSILAELLSAGLGVNAMLWQTSPAATELEELVMDWLRQMLNLPSSFRGVIQDTASTATLVALITAREKATGFQSNLVGVQEPLVVYCSEEAHSSVIKGAKIAGYGKDNINLIPADDKFAMLPEELEKAIVEDKEKGRKPACVVGTLGTTSSTAVDPMDKLGPICKKHEVWFHVDAAFAGTAAILPEKRWIMDGAEYLDSFVFNPHKWMLTNFDCSAYFVKDPEILQKTFDIHPEYLKTGVDAVVNNYRDWGIQLGRRFRALKLWFVLRYYGVEGLQAMVREHIRLAGLLKGWIEDDTRFELMAPVDFSLVCFRLNPGDRSEEELALLNQQLLEMVNATRKTLLTQTMLKSKYVIRFSIGQRTTEERHVREVWEVVGECAERVV